MSEEIGVESVGEGTKEDDLIAKVLQETNYTNVEALVKGYKDITSAFSSKSNFENKYNDLLEEIKPPEEYKKTLEIDHISDEVVKECSEKSKKLNLTQKQFEEFVKEMSDKEVPEGEKKSAEGGVYDSKFLEDHKLNSLPDDKKESILAALNGVKKPLVTNVANSSHGSAETTTEAKREAYKEMKKARETGDRRAERQAFERWKMYAER